MSAHVLLNLLNELRKIIKMRSLSSIFYAFSADKFNKFNNTRVRMLDSIYHMTFTPASNLGYLAPPGQFFMGAKLFIGTP